MTKKFLIAAVSLGLIIPITACGTQLFRKKAVANDERPTVVVGVSPEQERADAQLAVEVLDGEWVILQVGDTKIERDEDYPYINFVPAEDSFYASNGCNVLNGIFTYTAPNTLGFHNVITTMKYCADTPFDTQINAVIATEKPVRFTTDIVDGEPFLYFENENGQRLMTLHKPGLDFLNGNWQITRIGDEEFDDSEMTMFFDIESRKVHGNTGCNSFNGDIFVEPQNKRRLSLSNMAVTMRMCPNIDRQSKLMVALEKTAGAKLVAPGKVALVDAEGHSLMSLVSLPVK